MNNVIKSDTFDTFNNQLERSHNYFHEPTKLFSDLYLVKSISSFLIFSKPVLFVLNKFHLQILILFPIQSRKKH